MNILFRCDGSVKIGMGHVIRCLALADHLKENHGCKIHFAMRKSELGINRVKKSYPVIESHEESFKYVKWLSDCIDQTKSDTLIMDMRDGLTREELKSIKKKTGIKIVTIDDPEKKRLEADLAFYPPVPQVEKLNWNGYNGSLYVGWEYVLLRKEFSIKYPRPKNTIPHILISMGGTDERNMIAVVINILNEINDKFKAIIVVGPGYLYLTQLQKSLNSVRFQFDLFQNPENIASVISQADLAIISFGQTAYELAALNVPAIYLCLTDDHYKSSKLFVKEGIGMILGKFSDINREGFISEISSIITNQSTLYNMTKKASLINISDLHKISSLISRNYPHV
jgi:UDP-2,4-diacetamido-2,4,6-trideoxy-beta-L-altropyranose hydrolase